MKSIIENIKYGEHFFFYPNPIMAGEHKIAPLLLAQWDIPSENK